MSTIGLRVTESVIAHTKSDPTQQQIALRPYSDDLAAQLPAISRKGPKRLILGGLLKFVLSDQYALWRAHNADRAADFESLFVLLSRHPDEELRMECELRDL